MCQPLGCLRFPEKKNPEKKTISGSKVQRSKSVEVRGLDLPGQEEKLHPLIQAVHVWPRPLTQQAPPPQPNLYRTIETNDENKNEKRKQEKNTTN